MQPLGFWGRGRGGYEVGYKYKLLPGQRLFYYLHRKRRRLCIPSRAHRDEEEGPCSTEPAQSAIVKAFGFLSSVYRIPVLVHAFLPEIPSVTGRRNLWPPGGLPGRRSAEAGLWCAPRKTPRGARELQPGLETRRKPLAAVCVQIIRSGREDRYTEVFFTKESSQAAGDRGGWGRERISFTK